MPDSQEAEAGESLQAQGQTGQHSESMFQEEKEKPKPTPEAQGFHGCVYQSYNCLGGGLCHHHLSLLSTEPTETPLACCQVLLHLDALTLAPGVAVKLKEGRVAPSIAAPTLCCWFHKDGC